MAKLPHYDWNFNENAEENFLDWFHGNYGPFANRDEYFYEDCKVRDKKTLESLMYKWLHAAFVTGFTRGINPETRYGLPVTPECKTGE